MENELIQNEEIQKNEESIASENETKEAQDYYEAESWQFSSCGD